MRSYFPLVRYETRYRQHPIYAVAPKHMISNIFARKRRVLRRMCLWTLQASFYDRLANMHTCYVTGRGHMSTLKICYGTLQASIQQPFCQNVGNTQRQVVKWFEAKVGIDVPRCLYSNHGQFRKGRWYRQHGLGLLPLNHTSSPDFKVRIVSIASYSERGVPRIQSARSVF